MIIRLAQAATTPPEPSAFAEVLSIGGPISGFVAIVGFLVKLWLDSRRDRREDKTSDRQSESAIVETTSTAILMVRDQMIEMGRDIEVLRTRLQERDATIDRLQTLIREQAGEIAVLRSTVALLKGNDEQS